MRNFKRTRLSLLRSVVACLVALAAVALALRNFDVQAMAGPTVTAAPPNPTCFPSCQPNDGRFLSLAGEGLNTFVGGSTTIDFMVNGSETNFKIGIFDGNENGLWDQIPTGAAAPPSSTTRSATFE